MPHSSPYDDDDDDDDDDDNNHRNLLDSPCTPSTGLNAWHVLTHLIHPTTVWDWFYYYLYFIDKETKAGRSK